MNQSPLVWVTSRSSERPDKGSSHGNQNARYGVGLAANGFNKTRCHFIRNDTDPSFPVSENRDRARTSLLSEFYEHGPWPDIFVYGVGDDTGALQARVLKELCHESGAPQPNFISYMAESDEPKCSEADIIVVPNIFKGNLPDDNHIIFHDGIPHRLTVEEITEAAGVGQERLEQIDKYFQKRNAVVIIGNPTSGFNNNLKELGENLGIHLAQIAELHSLNLLVVTSPRTETKLLQKLVQTFDLLDVPNMLFDWHTDRKNGTPNPYPGVLGLKSVEAVFITPDTMSMVNEALTMKNRTFILDTGWILDPFNQKHNAQLIDAEVCFSSKALVDGASPLEQFQGSSKNPMAALAQQISARLDAVRQGTINHQLSL